MPHTIKIAHCPDKLEVRNHMGLTINIFECTRPVNHSGLHKCGACVWASTDKVMKSRVENEGKTL